MSYKRKEPEEKSCPVCGKKFIAKTVRRVWCSNECYKKFHFPPHEKIYAHCKNKKCGKLFVKRSILHVFCSRECCDTNERVEPDPSECLWCHKSVPRESQLYCSVDCRQNFRNFRLAIINRSPSAEYRDKELQKLTVLGSKYNLPKLLRPMSMDEFKKRIEGEKRTESNEEPHREEIKEEPHGLPHPYVLESDYPEEEPEIEPSEEDEPNYDYPEIEDPEEEEVENE